MTPHGRRILVRCALAATLAAPLASCSVPVPSFPAPWEAVETPYAEPDTAAAGHEVQRLRWERLGSSVRGKAIHAATIGSGPKRIYVLAGIRGDEPEAPAAARTAAEMLFASDVGRHATIRIIPEGNPDAVAARSRTNTRGVDIGRNWPARDWTGGDKSHGARAASELETVSLQKDIDAFKPDLVITLTSSARGPVVTLEGANSKLPAYEFASGARNADPRWRVVAERWKPEQGSPESYVTLNLKKPVLSIELARARGNGADAEALHLGLKAIAESTPQAPASK